MTIGELIEKLSELDPNARVVLAGYENSGADDIGSFSKVEIIEDKMKGMMYCGQHGIVYGYEDEDEIKGAVPAIMIRN